MIEVNQKQLGNKRLIWGSGPLDAKIVLIGTAPGVHEYRVGRPFYERAHAGGKLNEVMHLVGLSRSVVYMTNIIKELVVDDSKLGPFIAVNSRTGKVTTSPIFDEYVDVLKRELQALSSATVFVPLGNVAMWVLTGKIGITKWRGSILEGLFWLGMKVIPAIHPSAIYNEFTHRGEYLYMHYLRMDLKRVIEESAFKEIRLPQRNLRTEPDFIEVMGYIELCKTVDKLKIDIEVLNEEVSCISLAISWDDAMSIDFIREGHDTFTPDQETEIWQQIAIILANPQIKKEGQNIDFDLAFLFRKYGIEISNPDDTMIKMGIAYPDFPKRLPFQTAMFTKEPYYKDEGKKWIRSQIGTEHNFHLYNAKDSAILHEISPALDKVLAKQGNEGTYERQRKLIPIVAFMQERGTKMDIVGLREAQQAAGIKIDKLTEQLKVMVGHEINPNSPAQIMHYFYEERGYEPYLKKSSKGQSVPTSDYHALVRLARKGDSVAALLTDIRKTSKLKYTYFDVVLSSDNRLKSSKNPVGTKTGRLSSSESIFGEGTNDQNLPDSMRKFLIPDDGYVGYSVDLAQAENRIVAYTAPEHLMIQAFEAGIDLHSQTAGLILGIPTELVSDEEGSCALGNGEHSQRFWGKKSNHGLNYDMTYKRAALEWEIPEREAMFIVERFHAVYPSIRQKYHAWIRADLGRNRTIENPYGRKRLFLDQYGIEMFKDAYSHFAQSTVADKMDEDGLIPIYYDQQIYKFVEVLNQIHDEIVFQIPLSAGWNYHAQVLLAIKKSLEKPITWRGTTFTIPVDVLIGTNFAKSDMRKVKIDGQDIGRLAGRLSEIHRELRASQSLPLMDRYCYNSSGSPKEDILSIRSK